MKRTLTIIVALLFQSAWAKDDISTFHRLLITNDNDQLLLVKIKGNNFWVTPGWYQTGQETVQSGLKKLADDHGIEISPPKLKGMFALKNEKDIIFSMRYFYTARATSIELKKPEMIDEIRWVPLDEALGIFTFPHIRLLTKQVMEKPDTLWGGTVIRYKEKGEFKARMTENFYSL